MDARSKSLSRSIGGPHDRPGKQSLSSALHKQGLKREPGRVRRPKQAGERLVLLNATGKVGAGKPRRRLKRSSGPPTPAMVAKMSDKQKRISHRQGMLRCLECGCSTKGMTVWFSKRGATCIVCHRKRRKAAA